MTAITIVHTFLHPHISRLYLFIASLHSSFTPITACASWTCSYLASSSFVLFLLLLLHTWPRITQYTYTTYIHTQRAPCALCMLQIVKATVASELCLFPEV